MRVRDPILRNAKWPPLPAASVPPPLVAFEATVQPRPSSRQLASLALLIIVASCGGGDDGGTTNPPPIPQGFTVALSAGTLSVVQGASGSVTATIGRTGNFAGTVNLTVEGAPAGMTAAFAPSAITSTTTSTTLTVTSAVSVAPGTYALTVRGQAAGLSDQTGAISVTVTAKPAIAMALSPATLTIATNGNATYTATITRTNFSGAVAVAVTGMPAGVTASVATAADVHTVTIAVGAAVAAGNYTLTTTASGTGVTPVTGEVALTVTAAPAASIALSATPAAISIQAGGASAATHITITRTNFTGTVVVAAQSGVPTGVSVTNAPAGPTSANAVDVTFSATAAVAPGSYTVVLQGAGFQATPGTVQIALTVTAPNVSGSIALSLLPSTLSVQPGGIVTAALTIARTNFPGTVTLAVAVAGSPSAITANLSTTGTTGNAATLTVGAGSAAVVGSYSLTITASGAGIPAVQLTVPLSVAPIASGGNVSLRFCTGYTSIPIWFAVQNGGNSAPWTAVTAGAGNSYSFNIATVGAFAFVTQQAASSYQLTIVYGSAAELNGRATSYCPTQTGKSLTGTVSGFGVNNADFVSVSMGTAFASPQPSFALPNFSLIGVSPDAHDLVGTRSTFNLSNPTNPLSVNKIFLKRGLNPPNLSSVGTVDFEGPDAFAPGSTSLTINGLAQGEQVSVSNTFITSTFSYGSLGQFPISTGSTANVLIVPASKIVAGDVQAFAANAYIVSGSITSELRSVTAAYQDPTNRTVTLGARMNTPTISAAATAPYARLRSQATRQSDYTDVWSTNYIQLGGSPRSATITMSQAYIGNAGTYDVTIPDFSGVGSWQNTWGPLAGVSTTWNVTMIGWVAGGGGLSDGSIYRIAQRQGLITP